MIRRLSIWMLIACVIVVLAMAWLVLNSIQRTDHSVSDGAESEEVNRIASREISVIKAGQESRNALGQEYDWEMWLQVARQYVFIDDHNNAIKTYEMYLQNFPNNYTVWGNLAKQYERVGAIKKADNAFMNALKLPHESIYRDVSEFWKEHYPEKIAERKQLLTLGVERMGANPYFMVELGQIYLSEGNCDEAVAHYEVLVDLVPDNASAIHDLNSVKEQCATALLPN